MYLKYWDLREGPFENNLDPKYFFSSVCHDEALARLQFVLERKKPLTLLTGDYGLGKTYVIRELWKRLHPQQVQMAYLGTPYLPLEELLQYIAPELATGATPVPSGAAPLLQWFGDVLKRNHQIGRHTAILVDEAHLIQDVRIFEELRTLLNLSFTTAPLLSIILVGQTELREGISALPQLKQRVSYHYHLKPLESAELKPYIEHRLAAAGSPRPSHVFQDDALAALLESSKGNPRLLNTLAEAALMVGMSREKTLIDKSVVEEARQEALI
jgi:type II secretory pathway predicted ATPase ExeA